MNKSIFIAILIGLTPFMSFAGKQEIRLPLEVLSAKFDAPSDAIEMQVRYNGGCGERNAIIKNGCTDLYFPYTCIYTVYVATAAPKRSCTTPIEKTGYIPVKELRLDTENRNKWVYVELRGNKTRTSKTVEIEFYKNK